LEQTATNGAIFGGVSLAHAVDDDFDGMGMSVVVRLVYHPTVNVRSRGDVGNKGLGLSGRDKEGNSQQDRRRLQTTSQPGQPTTLRSGVH
jgi:hypothetical protein